MSIFLQNLTPFLGVLLFAALAFLGFLAAHVEALRIHRARTANRQASSFVWRA